MQCVALLQSNHQSPTRLNTYLKRANWYFIVQFEFMPEVNVINVTNCINYQTHTSIPSDRTYSFTLWPELIASKIYILNDTFNTQLHDVETCCCCWDLSFDIFAFIFDKPNMCFLSINSKQIFSRAMCAFF